MDVSLDSVNDAGNEKPDPNSEFHRQEGAPANMPSSMLQCMLLKAIHRKYPSRDCLPMRMIVMGPSNCGKTSLAMDAALDIAESSSSSTVIFLVPEGKRSTLSFPLSSKGEYTSYVCEKNDAHEIRNLDTFGKNQQFFLDSLAAMDMPCDDCVDNHEGTPSYWDSRKDALQRIRIKYIKSSLDLVQCLSTLEKGELEKPDAIIVDDLDQYICENTARDGSEDQQHFAMQDMKLIQLLAVLSDTCDHLDEAPNIGKSREKKEKKTQLLLCLNTDRLPHLSKRMDTIQPLIHIFLTTVVSIQRGNIKNAKISTLVVQKKGISQELPRCLSFWSMSLQHNYKIILRTNLLIGGDQ